MQYVDYDEMVEKAVDMVKEAIDSGIKVYNESDAKENQAIDDELFDYIGDNRDMMQQCYGIKVTMKGNKSWADYVKDFGPKSTEEVTALISLNDSQVQAVINQISHCEQVDFINGVVLGARLVFLSKCDKMLEEYVQLGMEQAIGAITEAVKKKFLEESTGDILCCL